MELKSALLLRSLPQSVKTHVSMTCSEDCTYEVLRETVVRWERNTQKWTQTLVNQTSPSTDTGGPMDVDRIKGKDKGKGKNNPKGEKGKFGGKSGKGYGYYPQSGKGEWSNKGGWNSSSGWSNSKGKDKGYHNKTNDTKGDKGKGKKGKGKTKDPNACRICGKPGHWGNECWHEQGPCPERVGGLRNHSPQLFSQFRFQSLYVYGSLSEARVQPHG